MGIAALLDARQRTAAPGWNIAARNRGGSGTVQIIREVGALRHAVHRLRADGGSLALVPTMGALHAGHMALVAAAQAQAAHVAASIFVNPTQFGPNEDFAAYPRDEARDAAMLADAGVAILWAPDVAAMYPPGHASHIHVAGLGADYCGAARPGHFDGVATVVAKLLGQVQPDVALFGEKDWQQLAVIRRMVADLDLPVAIMGVPIVREADGLARSSRNAYLSAPERGAAAAFPAALRAAAAAITAGAPIAATLADAEAAILAGGFDRIDYIALADAVSLERLMQLRQPARLLAAARIGRTRLIDNWPVG
jgi:pantoate--beta-alanine ligase